MTSSWENAHGGIFFNAFRVVLEKLGVWDKSRRLGKGPANETITIPIKPSDDTDLLVKDLQRTISFPFNITTCDLPVSKRDKRKSPYKKLEHVVVDFLRERNESEEAIKVLVAELPKSWEKHGDLVLFPQRSLVSPIWRILDELFWLRIAQALSCRRLAKKTDVITDDFRTPCVDLLLGSDGWVNHVDNGITYSYDITRCMFSAGNITEKLRVAGLDCKGEVIVDLYAGIGYFTIPYLVHAGATHVHACEWNPDAVSALRRNLEQNGVASRASIYEGNNRKVCPKNIADRVNLGLIPTSESGWPVACAALRKDLGGFLHIHENVSCFPNKEKHSRENGLTPLTDSASGIAEKYHSEHPETSGGFFVNGNNQCDVAPPCGKFAQLNNRNLKQGWLKWSYYARSKIKTLLQDVDLKSWNVEVVHIEHVKSYAPHVDHIVLDLLCRPSKDSS